MFVDEESSKIKLTTSPTAIKYVELLKRAPFVFSFVERFIVSELLLLLLLLLVVVVVVVVVVVLVLTNGVESTQYHFLGNENFINNYHFCYSSLIFFCCNLH